MDIIGYAVHFGNGLCTLVLERSRAEYLAARLGGYVKPAYELTERERQSLVELPQEGEE